MKPQPLPMRDATRGDRIVDRIWQRTGWGWSGRWLVRRRHKRWNRAATKHR